MKKWQKEEMVDTLVNTFFERDPYYPRPVPDNELYKAFKAGYMEGCPQGPDLSFYRYTITMS